MGDNTFRYSPGAPGVQFAGGGRGDRKQRAAAGLGGRDMGGRDMGGRDIGGRDTGGRDMGGRDMGGRDMGGRDMGGRDMGERETSGRSAGTGGQGGVGLLASVRGESNRRTGGAGDGDSQPERGVDDIVTVTAAPVPAEPSATYWRRRFIMLAAGLAVLGAASWGLSQELRVHPAGKSPSGTLQTSRNSSAPRAGSPAAGGGQHGANAGSQGGHGSGGSTGKSASGTVTSPSAAPRPTVTTSGFGGFRPTFCSWHSIVLSLSASQVHFGSGQPPAFSLSVVSTQPTDCSFNVGPGHLAVVVKEGPARIWSSADCVNGTGSLVTALRRGVPTVVAIDWNRRTSSPGCSGPARTVPAGSYTAYAVEGSIVSPPVTIRLS